MFALLRNLKRRLERADELEDQRHLFYEERLSFLTDLVKELKDLHAREVSIINEKLEVHDGRLTALDYWTRDVGRLAGVGGTPQDLETEIYGGDPLDVENFDEEMNLMSMATYPEPVEDADD